MENKLQNKNHHFAMIGKGAFGTAFGKILEDGGHQVDYWDITMDTNLVDVLEGKKYVFIAISAQKFREFLELNREDLLKEKHIFVSLMKGIELTSGMLMSDVLKDVLGIDSEIEVVAGPNIAKEILAGDQFGLSVSSKDILDLLEFNPKAQIELINNKEVIEWLSCLKNVYAIYSGYLKGAGKGLSERSKVLTEALGEIKTILTAVLPNISESNIEKLILSYAGIGDFMVTCFSESSRNFSMGKLLGEAKSYDDAIKHCGGVCEGVPTAKIVKKILMNYDISTPVLDKVVAILE